MSAIIAILMRSRLAQYALGAVLIFGIAWGYVEYREREAVKADRIERAEKAKQDAIKTMRKIDEATSRGGDAAAVRKRLRDLLGN